MFDEVTPLQGNFNKLKMLQKVLNDTPPVSAGGVGWLWWLDIDTVVDPAQVCVCSAVRLLCDQHKLCLHSALLRQMCPNKTPRDIPNVNDHRDCGHGALQTQPLEQYGGRDIVLWGERELVEAGDIQGATTTISLSINVTPCCA